MQPSPETICFLLPGLVHQLGNLLLTMQGGALHLGASSLEDTRRVLLTAVQRGTDSLQVLRALLGEPVHTSSAPAELLAQISELVRVPLRERGLGLDLRGEPAAMAAVSTACFVTAVAAAIHGWASAIPIGSGGPCGATVLQLSTGSDGHCQLAIRFDREPGSLPFPVAAAEVAGELSQRFSREPVTFSVSAEGNGLELRFPAAAIAVPGQP